MCRAKVSSEEWLFRRSYGNPLRKYYNPDGSATSRAFKLKAKDEGELSVNVKSLTTPELSILDPLKFILFELKNSFIEENNLLTFYDPLLTNTSHAVIVGMSIEDEILPALLAKNSKRVFL